jgi:hypothetical protein
MSRRHFTAAEDDYLLEHGTGPATALALGRTTASVAMRLGRLREDHVHPPPAIVTRACLRCGRPFPSEGPGNRICKACKNSTMWQGGGDFSVMAP